MLQGNRKDWKKAGVYCITCIVNNKKYIGCSKNIYSRINNHKYSLEKQSLKQENQYFIDDFKKYGYEKFNYEVLEYTSKNLKDKEFKKSYFIHNSSL